MTIASAGYQGTVTQEDWAHMAQFFGSDTGVATSTDCVASGVSGTRVVSVSAGTAWGWGVIDTLTGSNTVSLAANGTGSTRWDAIVLRRNWSTGTTTLVAVSGSSSGAIPTLTVNPGVQADQVLAMVAVPAGATSLVGATVRRYVQWPAQMTAGLFPPHAPSYGQRWVDLSAGSVMRQWTGSAWSDPLDPPYTSLSLASGYTSSSTPVGFRVVSGRVELRGFINRAAGFPVGFSPTLATIPTAGRPAEVWRGIPGTGASVPGALVEVTPAGVLRVWTPSGTSGLVNVYLDGLSYSR